MLIQEIERSAYLRKYTIDDVRRIFLENNCILVSNEYKNTKSKIAFTCNKHSSSGVQFTTLSALTNTRKVSTPCKFCRDENGRPYRCFSESKARKLCEERDFEFVKMRMDDRTGCNRSYIQFICNKHRDKGIQEVISYSMKKLKQCRYCAGLCKTTDDLVKELNDPNIELLEDYRGAFVKIKCLCKIHNVEWMVTPNNLRSGYRCPKCSTENRRKACSRTHEEFIKELSESNPNIEALTTYVNANKKITFRCKIHDYTWDCVPEKLLVFHWGCPICSRIRKTKNQSKTNEQFVKELNEINPNIEPLEEYVNGNTKILMRCKIHDYKWKVIPGSLLYQKTGCPLCSASHGEKEVNSILTKWGYKFEQQKRFQDCKDEISLPFDFYLPEYNICIEYDGEQHYENGRFKWRENGKRKNSFRTTKLHDAIKDEYCSTHKIPLIRIPYWESDDMESFLFDEMVRYGAILQ